MSVIVTSLVASIDLPTLQSTQHITSRLTTRPLQVLHEDTSHPSLLVPVFIIIFLATTAEQFVANTVLQYDEIGPNPPP